MMALTGLLNPVVLEIHGVILEAVWIYCAKKKKKFMLLLPFFLSWILEVNYLSSDKKKNDHVMLDTVCHLLQ